MELLEPDATVPVYAITAESPVAKMVTTIVSFKRVPTEFMTRELPP